MGLSNRHEKTLGKIFDNPLRSDTEWIEVESLLGALGAELQEGRGSRVRIYLNGIRAIFHRPHPKKETDKGAIKAMRRFLLEAGVRGKEDA